MGKGGDKEQAKARKGAKSMNVATKKMDSVENKYKLSDLSTDDLKKWARAYGIKDNITDRVQLLKELVKCV